MVAPPSDLTCRLGLPGNWYPLHSERENDAEKLLAPTQKCRFRSLRPSVRLIRPSRTSYVDLLPHPDSDAAGGWEMEERKAAVSFRTRQLTKNADV